MINRVIEEVKTKYWYFIVLAIYVCVFLVIACCDFLPENTKLTGLIVNEKELKTQVGIIDDVYITQEDLLSNFNNNVYYDKIARKLVITSKDNMLKIKSGEQHSLLKDGTMLYNIYSIGEYFGYTAFMDTKLNSIYMYNEDELSAIVLKNRTEVYSKFNSQIIGILDAKSEVSIILDDNVSLKDEDFYTVKIVNKNGYNYIGRINKKALYHEEINIEKRIDTFPDVIMTTIQNKLTSNTNLNLVNTLAVQMLRISSEKNITVETYTLPNNITQDIYAVLSNGYRQTNFDNSILSGIITSDTNKEAIANQIIEYVNENELKGIVIDFKNFKLADKDLIEQYIKELAVILHKNNKMIMVKMSSSTTYNLENIKEFVDYIVVQAYGYRTPASKTSGSHATVSYVNNMLEQFSTKVNTNKLILELSTYSILWTEKSGSVINAEIYSMNMVNEYIDKNGCEIIFDNVSGQNMINYTKGSITYKMWLEDKTSLSSKIKLARDIGISSFAIYRSGYENKSIYTILDFKEE